MQILKASEPVECPTFLLMKYVQKANHAYTKKDEVSLKENAKLIVETICDMYLYRYRNYSSLQMPFSLDILPQIGFLSLKEIKMLKELWNPKKNTDIFQLYKKFYLQLENLKFKAMVANKMEKLPDLKFDLGNPLDRQVAGDGYPIFIGTLQDKIGSYSFRPGELISEAGVAYLIRNEERLMDKVRECAEYFCKFYTNCFGFYGNADLKTQIDYLEKTGYFTLEDIEILRNIDECNDNAFRLYEMFHHHLKQFADRALEIYQKEVKKGI